MNNGIDLYEILKHCPRLTRLYSPLFGDVYLDSCLHDSIFVDTKTDLGLKCFNTQGLFYSGLGECLLFPSRECRDWSKWKFPVKFGPATFQPFDKVLVRLGDTSTWAGDFISETIPGAYKPCTMTHGIDGNVIPYNDDTRHLVGTTDEAPEYYRYWEE